LFLCVDDSWGSNPKHRKIESDGTADNGWSFRGHIQRAYCSIVKQLMPGSPEQEFEILNLATSESRDQDSERSDEKKIIIAKGNFYLQITLAKGFLSKPRTLGS